MKRTLEAHQAWDKVTQFIFFGILLTAVGLGVAASQATSVDGFTGRFDGGSTVLLILGLFVATLGGTLVLTGAVAVGVVLGRRASLGELPAPTATRQADPGVEPPFVETTQRTTPPA